MSPQPGQIGNIVPKQTDPGAIMRMISDMQAQIKALQGALVVNGLTTNGQPGIIVEGGGTLKVVDSDGHTVALIGALPSALNRSDGTPQPGFALYREDDSLAAILGDLSPTVPPYKQSFQVVDRDINVIFADDTNSGFGLASPHLQLGTLFDTNTTRWPSTSATTWTSVASQFVEIQAPHLTWYFTIYSPAGVTGQFRVLLGGTQIGTTASLAGGGSGNFAVMNQIAPVPGGTAFSAYMLFELQAQVTAGSGTLLTQQLLLSGTQSS